MIALLRRRLAERRFRKLAGEVASLTSEAVTAIAETNPGLAYETLAQARYVLRESPPRDLAELRDRYVAITDVVGDALRCERRRLGLGQ